MAQSSVAAQLKIDAIDQRIDAVRAELVRRVGEFDQMSARAWQMAWDSVPGLQGIERSLFARRGAWQIVRDTLAAKEAKAAERRFAREYNAINARRAPICGFTTLAA